MHACTMAQSFDTLSIRLNSAASKDLCLLKLKQSDSIRLLADSRQHCAEALSADCLNLIK